MIYSQTSIGVNNVQMVARCTAPDVFADIKSVGVNSNGSLITKPYRDIINHQLIEVWG